MAQDAFPEAVLTKLIARHLGTSPESLTLRRSPTGKFNETHFVDGGPVPLVLRVAPPDDRSRMLFYEHRMMRQEPALHALVRGRTDVPVPAVLAHDFSRTEIDRDYLLMERLPGTPISHLGSLTQDAFNDLLRQVGRFLRQVHEITGDRHGYVGDHRPMEPQPDWPSAFHIMWHKLLDDIEGCGGYTPDEASRMRRLLDRHAEVFDRPVPASLLHMDVWAENILADERGRLTGLIDWDRALMGRPGDRVRHPGLLRHQRAAVLGGIWGCAGPLAGGRDPPGLLPALRGAEVYRHPPSPGQRPGAGRWLPPAVLAAGRSVGGNRGLAMRRKIGLGLLYVAGSLVIAGSMYDLFVPTVPPNLLAYQGVTPATIDPRVAALDLGLLRALGGCLLAIGATALVLVHGPIRRGERGRYSPW